MTEATPAARTPRLNIPVGLPMLSFASMITETIADKQADLLLTVKLEDNRNYVYPISEKVPVVQAVVKNFISSSEQIRKGGVAALPAAAAPNAAPAAGPAGKVGLSASSSDVGKVSASGSKDLAALVAGSLSPKGSPKHHRSPRKEAESKEKDKKDKKDKKKRKKHRSSVFGVPLETLVANENEEAAVPDCLPGIARQCIQYLARFALEVPGIFAIGNLQYNSSEAKKIIESVEGGNYDFMKGKTPKVEDKNPQSILECSFLLLHFLRELPDPLISEEVWKEMLKINETSDPADFNKNIKLCLKNIPQVNRDLLSALFTLLHIIHLNRASNFMTAENLSAVFAPLLFRNHSTPFTVENHRKANLLLTKLILRVDELFHLIQEPATDSIYASSSTATVTYVDLCKILLEPSLSIVSALGSLVEVTQLEQLAKDLVFCFYKNKQHVSLLKKVIRNEVQATVDSGTLFRTNSIATHLLTQLSRILGLKYLRQLLYPLIKSLTQIKDLDTFEFNSGAPAKIEENKKFILDQTKKFFDAIINSVEECPTALRGILGILQEEVLEKFPASRYISVGGFYFLRFACPAIVSPEGFGVISAVSPEVRKGLVIISKTIQNISNGTVNKETNMSFVNDFIQSSIPTCREFLDKIADCKISPSPLPDEIKVKHAAMARIHYQLNEKLMEIDEKLSFDQDNTKLRKDLMETLSKLGSPPPKEILELRDRFPILAARIVGHQKSIQTITVSSDGKTVWSADLNGVIRGWDADTGELRGEIQSNLHNIFAIASVHSQMWVSAEALAVYDCSTGKLIKTITSEPTFSFVVVGDKVWCAGQQSIQIYDPKKLDSIHSISTQGKMFFTLAHIGNTVWGGTNQSSIVIWNASTFKQIKDIKEGHTGKINAAVRVAATSTIWSSADDSKICVWDANTYELLKTFNSHRGKIFNLCDFGNQVWSLSWDNSIQIWHATSLTHVGELSTGHTDAINSVVPAWNSLLNEWVAWTGSLDRSVCVWRVQGCNLPAPTEEESSSSKSSSSSKKTKKLEKGTAQSSSSKEVLKSGKEKKK